MTAFGNTSVLVVDDSSTMRTLVGDMLRRLGFRTIETAESGEDAISRLKSRSFGLIISDWNMPGLSGLDLLGEVRRTRTPSSCRFVFATSERSFGHQTTAKLEGADAFVSKPFTIDALRAKLETVLSR